MNQWGKDMIIINSLKEIKNIDKSVVTIGKFDGIHKGHTVLIEKAVDLAKKENLKSIVFTFKNNPISYFSNILTREIITEDEKMDKLKSSQRHKQLKLIRQTLELSEDEKLFPFSSETKQGIDEVWEYLIPIFES